MALFKARVLYDFTGEPNTGEISITAGEILNVTRVDIGEGWYEGRNGHGQTGLFPEAYVDKIEDSGPPSMPPPALPPANLDGWGDRNQPELPDDDWDADSDDDNYSQIQNVPRETIYSNEPNQNQYNYRDASDNVSVASFNANRPGAAPKKGLNIFSSMGKSGLDSYILGTLKSVPTQKIQIIRENDFTFRWPLIPEAYTVQIASPKKEAKLGGLKTFIAYQLTPSFSNITVSRRYKHFDWLHDRLSEKFHLIAIPPLPDKQISGRYEEQFVEHRRVQLQEFINYMCRHPILSACDVWLHFLSCTNEKEWKEGKRRAEKDTFIGANFCLCIDAPEKELLNSTVENVIENRNSYIGQIDHAIKVLMQCATDQTKKNETMFRREHSKVGDNFLALANSLQQGSDFNLLSDQMKELGVTYSELGVFFGQQSKMDWQPLADKLYLYKGITSSFGDIFSLQKQAEQRKKDCEKNTTGQMQPAQLTDIRRRTDILTYAVFAELDHLQREINSEFKMSMRDFVAEQLNFYKKIVQRFEKTLNSIA